MPPEDSVVGSTVISRASLLVVVLLGGIATPYLSSILYTPFDNDSTSLGYPRETISVALFANGLNCIDASGAQFVFIQNRNCFAQYNQSLNMFVSWFTS